MRHKLKVELEYDGYTDVEDMAAVTRMVGALRAAADLFEIKGITNDGKAETESGTRIQWTAEQQDTRQ